MRLTVIFALSAALAIAAPASAHAEAFSSFWSTLSESERDFVDHVAAGMYYDESGSRTASYRSLNSASKSRYRARAVDILDVKNRPARSNTRGADI